MTDGSRQALEQEGEGPSFLGIIPLILLDRKWLILSLLALFTLAGLAVALFYPPTYRSSAVLLVESPDLPTASTTAPLNNAIDRRIARIRQQILSRPDLVDLIQANNLYNVQSRAEPLSKLVDRMRENTTLEAIDADIARSGNGRSAGSIAFSLAFDYSDSQLAQLVAQTFVDRLQKLDASSTQSNAMTSVRYLEDQETALGGQVVALETQINRITGTNGAALAANGGISMMNMGGGGDIEGQIAGLRRENATLMEQQRSSLGVQRDPNVLAAESQLATARATYADDHPDVILAESRLAAAKANAKSFQTNTASTVVQQQVTANNQAIAELERAKSVQQARLTTMAAAQARGPAVAQQVQQLQGRADTLRAELSKVSSSLLDARSTAKMAEEQRGERLTLIDPPVAPDRPTSPNRPLMIIGGIVAGLAAGIGLALLLEFIRRPIRHVSTLTRLTGAAPLAVIPTLTRKRPRRRKLFGFRAKA